SYLCCDFLSFGRHTINIRLDSTRLCIPFDCTHLVFPLDYGRLVALLALPLAFPGRVPAVRCFPRSLSGRHPRSTSDLPPSKFTPTARDPRSPTSLPPHQRRTRPDTRGGLVCARAITLLPCQCFGASIGAGESLRTCHAATAPATSKSDCVLGRRLISVLVRRAAGAGGRSRRRRRGRERGRSRRWSRSSRSRSSRSGRRGRRNEGWFFLGRPRPARPRPRFRSRGARRRREWSRTRTRAGRGREGALRESGSARVGYQYSWPACEAAGQRRALEPCFQQELGPTINTSGTLFLYFTFSNRRVVGRFSVAGESLLLSGWVP
ncbi:hypothetical protein B0H14DRAFT_3587999, partial [Mycena olivaceomarginata]